MVAGWSHTCARKADGTVWCWGINNAGQLGSNETSDQTPERARPQLVAGLTGGAVHLTAGDSHACAIVDGGQPWCWGSNADGQLGDGTTQVSRLSPVKTKNLVDAILVSAGASTTCAIRASHGVSCWGSNAQGELGNGLMVGSSVAVEVPGLTNITGLSVGFTHVCALDATGQVWCWGENTNGQLGLGTTDSPQRTPKLLSLTGVSSIAAGLHTTCATKTDGTVWCWGQNNLGQVGGSTSSASEPTPKHVPGLVDMVEVSASGFEQAGPVGHTCARGKAGSVWCWGANSYGELGNNASTHEASTGPTQTQALPDALRLGVGAKHSCAIRRNGTVWCWGSNDVGQLGDTTFAERHLPAGTVLSCP